MPVRLSPRRPPLPPPRVCLLTRRPRAPRPQVTPPCTWRPSTATRSASASCCRYRGRDGGREAGRRSCHAQPPGQPQRGALSALSPSVAVLGSVVVPSSACGSGQPCSALRPRQGAASPWAAPLPVPDPAVTQALSLRPPAPWTWLTAAAGRRCTTQVSGDGASPVPLAAPREAALSLRPSFSPAVSGCISCSEILCDFKAPLNVKDKVRSPCSSPRDAFQSSETPGRGWPPGVAAPGVPRGKPRAVHAHGKSGR